MLAEIRGEGGGSGSRDADDEQVRPWLGHA
jgi:hypothetical protein